MSGQYKVKLGEKIVLKVTENSDLFSPQAVKVESRQFYLVGTDILLFACLVQQFSVFACLVSCKGSTDDIFDHEVAVVAVTSIIVSLVCFFAFIWITVSG